MEIILLAVESELALYNILRILYHVNGKVTIKIIIFGKDAAYCTIGGVDGVKKCCQCP